MKKFIYKTICTALSLTIFMSMAIIKGYASEESIDVQFDNIQNEISNSLEIDEENDRYIYNSEYIQDLFEDFDVEAFNDYYGTEYTKQSLYDFVIYRLDTVRPSQANIPVTRGDYCGRNYFTTGWNYQRWFTDKSKTNEWIGALRSEANSVMWTSGISAILSTIPGAGVLAAIDIILGPIGWYKDTLADSLSYNNNLSNCGCVTDFNVFTTIFTIWNQANFYE